MIRIACPAVGLRIEADGKALPDWIAVLVPLPILACDPAEQLKGCAIVECRGVLRQVLVEERNAERSNRLRSKNASFYSPFPKSEKRWRLQEPTVAQASSISMSFEWT